MCCRGAKNGNLLEELRKEARLMAVLRHPNIVMFLGACYSPPCMVTEYCARGSLLDILSRTRDCPVRPCHLCFTFSPPDIIPFLGAATVPFAMSPGTVCAAPCSTPSPARAIVP
jgi:serine/threonine protein kinase